MDVARLNLEELETRRYLEFGYPMHEAVVAGRIRADMNIAEPARLQQLIRQVGGIAQDAFSALIVRQSGIRCASEPLPLGSPRRTLPT